MDVGMLTRFFMWCTILNMGLLALSFLILAVAGDSMYKIHSKWFPMPRETYNVLLFSWLAIYKIIVIVFNVMPWAVLAIIA
ncbi:MAG: DUF6868 family protein [Planctomycetota bacterium]|jgi:hypothetical protein